MKRFSSGVSGRGLRSALSLAKIAPPFFAISLLSRTRNRQGPRRLGHQFAIPSVGGYQRDPAQHGSEPPSVQMSFRQQKPVAGMLPQSLLQTRKQSVLNPRTQCHTDRTRAPIRHAKSRGDVRGGQILPVSAPAHYAHPANVDIRSVLLPGRGEKLWKSGLQSGAVTLSR